MTIYAIDPDADTRTLLAGAQFADAFRVAIDDPALNARQAAERMLAHSPPWVDMLMAIRNAVVAPFGLKTPAHRKTVTSDVIGIFPVVSETPDRVVAGFDDKHLNFRVVVDVTEGRSSREITATTLVLTHNLLGRIYLAIILPFHRIIVSAMLRQIAGIPRNG